MNMENITINFNLGTLSIEGNEADLSTVMHKIIFDKRTKMYRAKACDYAEIILALRKNKIPHYDNAKNFNPIDISLQTNIKPRTYQTEALAAWKNANYRGIISLPTGSGKSFLALMAINYIKRPALIIVPTIDLMHQWANQVKEYFKIEPGYLGGGLKDVRDITVSTYDSAVIHMEFIGNKFGLLVYDECHHLPSPTNKLSASMSIAPYRIGLSATPETDDEYNNILYSLIGPIIFDISIKELKGSVLSPYLTKKIYVNLTEEEEKEYSINRRIYTDFIRSNRIDFSARNSWQKFIGLCARKPNGKPAYKAYLKQKEISRSCQNKISSIWELIKEHNNERIIIFTADNDTAYKIGCTFFLPVLTHKTKPNERKDFLEKFREGTYHILVTSKVLNEGIDVPEANVGIIVSGSGSIREHVQRLGRILRPSKNKEAILYEIISRATGEESVSIRRRQHIAYKK
jgi:superfamily II DNA or RNA helicase